MRVRRAEPGDFAAVADLLIRAFLGGGFTSAEHAATLRDVAPRAAVMALLVATDETGTLLGAVFWGTGESGYPDIAEAGEGELQLLAVEPTIRGRGIAGALVDACLAEARARGLARMVLSTQPTMTAAHRVYERRGFRRVPARDWERGDVPRLVYARDL